MALGGDKRSDMSPTGQMEGGNRARLVLGFAGVLLCLLVGIRFSDPSLNQPIILGLLALLAVAGVFFLFALFVGVVRLTGTEDRETMPDTLLDAMDEAYVVVENERLIYANEAYRAFFSDGHVQTVERLFSSSLEISEAIYRLAQAARQRCAMVEEIRLAPSLNGTRDFAWYRLSVKPLVHAGRNAILWIVSDITKERQHQENVFQELQHAIDYLDHAPAGFLSSEASGAIVYMNATLAEWLDYDLARVGSGGLTLRDIMADNAVEMMRSIIGTPGETRTETLDIDLRGRTGQSLPVRLFHRLDFGSDSEPMASRTLVLNRSESLNIHDTHRSVDLEFTRFFNNTPIAIATLTKHGGILRTNASFIRLFGASLRHGQGSERARIHDLIESSQRKEIDNAIAAAVCGKAGVQPLELSIAGEGDKSARVWVSAANDSNESDEECAVVYALDTTDFRQVEQQLVQAQKMNAIGQLAGGIAHDFNNVLQAILGYCELLKDKHGRTDPSFQDINQIEQNANRAASLVRQLLAFSRRQTLRPEMLNLSECLSDLTILLKRLLGERIELEFRHGRDLWPVLADVHQLGQVLMNLAVNARDAMPEGGHLGIRTENITAEQSQRLNVQSMPSGDYVLIEVTDTGSGMSPEVAEKIFEPFFTTKEIGKGTGLGLSTVFGIIKQSGGFIDVQSVLGEGTAFSIYLPRHIAVVVEPAIEVRASAPRMPAPDMTGQGVILLVEDEDPVRAVNARALTARGYTVLEAASGVEALQVIDDRQGPVDLVISDVVMPEMDGPTLLGELRKRYSDLKVIFVSGYAEEAFRKHLPEDDSFKFLPKPFGLKQLVETVKEVLRS